MPVPEAPPEVVVEIEDGVSVTRLPSAPPPAPLVQGASTGAVYENAVAFDPLLGRETAHVVHKPDAFNQVHE